MRTGSSRQRLGRAGAGVDRGGMDYPLHAPKAFVLMELDRFDEARFELDTGARLSDQLGTHWHQASYLMAYAVQRYLSGEWDDAGEDADTSDELADVTGEGYHLIITRGVQALMQLHRNDVEAAADTARRAMDAADRDRRALPPAVGDARLRPRPRGAG